MNQLRRFFELPPAMRRRVITAWWLLLRFWIAVRLRPFRRVTAQARIDLPAGSQWGPATPDSETGADALIDSEAWCVGAATKAHLLPMHCLERSLTLQRMLRQCGIAAELQIGVEKQGATIAAHAWLEVDGRAIVESESISERFAPLVSH